MENIKITLNHFFFSQKNENEKKNTEKKTTEKLN